MVGITLSSANMERNNTHCAVLSLSVTAALVFFLRNRMNQHLARTLLGSSKVNIPDAAGSRDHLALLAA